MKKKKTFKLSLAIALSMSLLATTACGNNGGNAESNTGANAGANTGNTAAEQPANNEPKDPFGPLPEKTKMTIFKELQEDYALPEGETGIDNRYVKLFEEKLNVDYDFTVTIKAGPAAEDKKKLLVSSDDIPDAMTVNYDLMLQMIKSDMIEDITDEFEQYASDELKEALKTDGGKALGLVTVDGKLYGIPAMATVHDNDPQLWVRQEWLDKLGLQPPKTVDDLQAIAKAFIEKDPDGNGKADTVGLVGRQEFANINAAPYSYDGIFEAYNSYVKIWRRDAEGVIRYGSVMPETKNALAKLREMYEQGILPKEFPISKQEQVAELVISGKAGIFFGPWWSGWSPLTDAIKADPKADWRSYVLQNVDGEYKAKQMAPVVSIAVIKKGFKYPEALVKTMNMYYAVQVGDSSAVGGDPYEGLPLPSWQAVPIPIPLWRADSVIFDHNNIQAAIDGKPMPEGVGEAMLTLYKTTAENWKKGLDFLKQNPDLYGEPVSRMYGVQPIIENNVEPIYADFFGTTKTLEQRKANLEKLETDAMIKIITGEKPLEYFDEFVKQWYDQGGQKITDEINELVGK